MRIIKAGTRVRIINRPYGTTHEGALVRDLEWSGAENHYTIRLDDGHLFRNEGVLQVVEH